MEGRADRKYLCYALTHQEVFVLADAQYIAETGEDEDEREADSDL